MSRALIQQIHFKSCLQKWSTQQQLQYLFHF